MALPLRGPVSTVPLTGPRLLWRALAAFQFSPVMRISEASGAGIAEFQEAVRKVYPYVEFETDKLVQIVFEGDTLKAVPQEVPLWRFFDDQRVWRISLSRESVAIEVKPEGYTNREDFAERIKMVLAAVHASFEPSRSGRIGVRYVNSFEHADSNAVVDVCNQQLVSITGLEEVLQADLAWRFAVEEGELILKSGVSPAGTSHDPGVLEPSEIRRWYLDIDVWNPGVGEFDADLLAKQATRQINRAHAIYCWAVPDTNTIARS